MKREVIVFLCATALLGSCGGERKSGGGATPKDTLVIAFDGSPANLDPRVGTNAYDGRIWDLAASGLIKLTPSGDFTSDLAGKVGDAG